MEKEKTPEPMGKGDFRSNSGEVHAQSVVPTHQKQPLNYFG
jgi:hypothetical protein